MAVRLSHDFNKDWFSFQMLDAGTGESKCLLFNSLD